MRTAALVTTAFAMTAAAPAIAAPPERESRTIDAHIPAFIPCDGFDIDARFTGTLTFMVFRAPDGEVRREVIHRHLEGTLTNTRSGTTYRVRETDKFAVDASGTVTLTGALLHVISPRSGTQLLIAGRQVFDSDGNERIAGRADDPCSVLT